MESFGRWTREDFSSFGKFYLVVWVICIPVVGSHFHGVVFWMVLVHAAVVAALFFLFWAVAIHFWGTVFWIVRRLTGHDDKWRDW